MGLEQAVTSLRDLSAGTDPYSWQSPDAFERIIKAIVDYPYVHRLSD